MRIIKPTGKHGVGRQILVDGADYHALSKYRWHIAGLRNSRPGETPKPYAARCAWMNGKTKVVLMHREVMDACSRQSVDHVDGNGLNNCRVNLRVATQSQNLANMRVSARPHSSRYKGVFFNSQPATHRSPWWARICKDQKRIHIGVYRTEDAAALAYNDAALRLFGEFARLNVVDAASGAEAV